MNSIRFELLTDSSLNEHIVVGASVYCSPEVVNREHLSWKHLRNPFGPSTSVSLRNEHGGLVGRSFIQPRTLWLSPTIACRGATITDLVVRPEDRNAAALIGMTRATLAPEEVDVVAHTSNDVSDLIYRKLFKFQIAFSLVANGLPIRVSNVLKKRFGNRALARVLDLLVSPWRWALSGAAFLMANLNGIRLGAAPTEAAMSKLFDDFRKLAGAHFERSRRFLNWRFSEGPLFNGEVEWVWRRGQCMGFLVFKRVALGGLELFVIMDAVLCCRLRPMEAVALKLVAVRQAIDHSCDAIFSLANTNNPALEWLSGFPFVFIPDRYLPHTTPIFIHASDEYRSLEKQESVFFTLADLDYF